MAWEERGSNRYYYRKVWRGDTCHSEYAGQGWLADLAFYTDGREREERARQRKALERFIQDQRHIDQSIDWYRAEVRSVVATVLQQLGFHQHKGQWRKARNMADKVAQSHTGKEKEFYRLMKAAEKNPAAIEQFRKYAQANPDMFDGPSILARLTLDKVMTAHDMTETSKITVKGELHALRRELGAASATPVERLLIEDVVITWLRLQLMEWIYSENIAADSYTMAKAEHMERRLSATRRRYLQSMESLARVRGLLARVGMQINVANQQVVQNG